MKLGVILALFLVILSLFGHHNQGQGAASPPPPPKICHEKMTLAGKCGSSGAYDCLVEFLIKYGAGSMPMHATCTDVDQQRLCQCDIICG